MRLFVLIAVAATIGCERPSPTRDTPAGAFARLAPCIDTADARCLYEELDRLHFARTADQKHTKGLESALEDRAAEVARLHDALTARQKEASDAIAAAEAKEHVIQDAMASLAKRDEQLKDASLAIEERDERLTKAATSIAEKDELVRRFEELASIEPLLSFKNLSTCLS